jgi:hypothetical protein
MVVKWDSSRSDRKKLFSKTSKSTPRRSSTIPPRTSQGYAFPGFWRCGVFATVDATPNYRVSLRRG